MTTRDACGVESSGPQIELTSILKAIDSMDPELFSRIITEDSRMKFGNFPESAGKEDVKLAQIEFFAGVKSVKHRVIRSWWDNSSIVAQMEVTYGRHDGTMITLPVVDVFEIRDDKVSATLIYMDISPLYQK